MTKPRALVIGGSLGGLFAASMLRDIGWDVRVFERVGDDLASRGAGIGTHDELMNVIRRLGLPVDNTIGVRVRTRICLDRSGHVTHKVELPQFMSAWARIYRLLKDALPADCCRFGATLERIEQDGNSVTAVFTDGTRTGGELLVGADGLRSTVRAQLLPAAEARYAGYVAWRGVADESDIPRDVHAALFEKYTFCLPAGEMMLAYPVPGRDNETRAGRRGYNFVWYRPTGERDALPRLCTDGTGRCHGQAIAPQLIRPEVIAAMKSEARALLAPQIAGIVGRTAQPFFQAIYDLESPQIALGRAVLLGDAAFVARPHVGMGVTKAALDAQCLADALRGSGNVHAALVHYDRERRRFGGRIVARARGLGAYIEARSRPDGVHGAAAQQPPADVIMREIGSSSVDIHALTAAA